MRDEPISVPDPDDDSWRQRLKWKRVKVEQPDGSKVPVEVLDSGLGNVVTILCCHEDWRGVIARDDFSLSILTLREPPWHEDDRPTTGWALGDKWSDEDFTRVRTWFERGFELDGERREMKAKKADIEDAIPLVAARNAFHPLRDFLRSLVWDQTDRIGGAGGDVAGWFHSYMGAADSTYTRTVGRWWLVSAVARALRPGCKADCMAVFQGKQGKGKSTACRALGSNIPSRAGVLNAFTDQIKIDEIAGKDGKQLLHSGKWIIEFAELDGLSRSETSRIKSSASGQEDFFRAPYAKAPKEHQRQCIFVGSVNEETWLRDETGNRRFWPVTVEEEHPIDMTALNRDRDQLLAQAVALFDAGERWWPLPNDPIADHLEREQSARMMTDDWADRIAEWLDSRGTIALLKSRAAGGDGEFVTTAEIGTEVLKIEIGKWGRAEQMRAGGCLARLGFERAQITRGGRRTWVYRRPEKPPASAREGPSVNDSAPPLYLTT